MTKTGTDTVLSKIIELVENAQAARAPVQQLADDIARKFVPSVICIASLVVTGWLTEGRLAENYPRPSKGRDEIEKSKAF